MDHVFLLQNQDKFFLSKHNEWVDGHEPGSLFKSRHKDEALNQLVEVNAKDVDQRIRILTCPARPNGLPDIDPDLLPPRQRRAAPEAGAAEVAIEAAGEFEPGNLTSELAVNEP